MDDDYGVKIALMEEYKKVLKYKRMYEGLVEAFQSLNCDLLDYANKHRIDLPNRDRVYRNMEKAKELIEYRIAETEPLSDETNKI
jgi:hypothetical protein